MNYMNKILAVITAAIRSCSSIFAMQEAPDTLLHITTPSNLLITESPAGMKVTVTDSVSGECIDSVLTEYSSYASIKTDTDTGKGYFREKRPGHNILELCKQELFHFISKTNILALIYFLAEKHTSFTAAVSA